MSWSLHELLQLQYLATYSGLRSSRLPNVVYGWLDYSSMVAPV